MPDDFAVSARATNQALPITTTPRATARLQLHKGFTFDDAASVVPYLAKMGISHVYTSPILTARPGSTHGYDIVDHSTLNPEFGGEVAFHRMVSAIRRHGMGLIVDIVPNHMGVGGADNAWWLDVLEWGRNSPFAGFFDIDWLPPDQALHNRIQAPFLGGPYGTCLEAGDITLRFDEATGRLSAVYGEHVFPITPPAYESVFGELVSSFAAALAPGASKSTARAASLAMQEQLAYIARTQEGRDKIAAALARFSPQHHESRGRLHRLLDRQHFRLVWWRAAADELNWRRFFDVTSLAGLRAALPAVFEATHALILKLYASGLIDGVRIDHVDGLADPRGYCRKLRRRMDSAGRQRPATAPPGPPYIVVEKILAGHERLPTDWMTDGTTGYDFMDQVGAVLHNPDGERPLADVWADISATPPSTVDAARGPRRVILRDALASELNGTAAALLRVARVDLATRDYTLTAIRRALIEILVHFPVYRLYAGLAGRPKMDDNVLAWAMAGARRTMRAADHPLLDQINLWLGGESARNVPPGVRRRERLRAIVRFEQLSSPVAAKSMEDTAFYRYGRLLSRNEVGSSPAQFSRSVASFHAAANDRQQKFPHAMLAVATHDHKRGADVRARLAVLSDVPEEWAQAVRRWSRLNAPLRRELDGGAAPEPGVELMLYQMLVGAWPPDLASTDVEGVAAFAERIATWQQKALREAKHRTAWVAPDDAYEAACRDFIFKLLDPARSSRVVDEIAEFAARIGPAGAINGLTQSLLHMTCPGVPDLYQGTERWDFSLVDPDNRVPVDYDTRREGIAGAATSLHAQLSDWHSGQIKQTLIMRALRFRQSYPAFFANGRYRPIAVEGPASSHVLAFGRFGRRSGRRHDSVPSPTAIVAVTLNAAALAPDARTLTLPGQAWKGTELVLPRSWGGLAWNDVLTGASHSASERLKVGDLLSGLPVALLAHVA
jgi:(1->4)-alpha-D-glucan 1-alpha-D-glucosylmutase